MYEGMQIRIYKAMQAYVYVRRGEGKLDAQEAQELLKYSPSCPKGSQHCNQHLPEIPQEIKCDQNAIKIRSKNY